MSAILAGANCNRSRSHPEARKRAEKAKKAEEWQLKASPPDPPSRGLFPRHLRATFASFFVHFPIWCQTAPPQGGKGINSIKKIVQICARLCNLNKRFSMFKARDKLQNLNGTIFPE
ncbi:hypothetical protein ACQUY2_11150 [Enterobacter hormaechei]|uniref:hypothetical protein n=1 Tax=Enterobacter cloacae complex TaxID=354276 RepID=UPI0020740CCE|nr:hypothetical protein [Enterobacter hormaechei]MDS0032771.1 hypothetical protein [Enterobacter hormaechei subsp. xiangfangensis]HCQ7009034.1 hypothetical protein [Enterobacter hormaechei]